MILKWNGAIIDTNEIYYVGIITEERSGSDAWIDYYGFKINDGINIEIVGLDYDEYCAISIDAKAESCETLKMKRKAKLNKFRNKIIKAMENKK